jgi:tetratricopeptide (TPR) repeat protein
MPLAIELAAARVRLLGVDGVHKRLDERLHILTGGTRAMLQRHQTLRTALEWSYNLLSRDEQAVFRRLGVFVGGFTLDLAQSVAADEQIDPWAVLDLLGHLVDKSLVIADGDELPRYRLLETVRAFALETLAAAGETPTLLRRHAEALLAFLLPLDDLRWTTKTTDQIRTGAELDNLRAALTWAESKDGDRTHAYALIGASRRIWFASNQLNEGIERACRLLPLPDGITTEMDARFHLALGYLGYLRGRRECFVAAMRAAELLRALGDTSRLIDALMAIAFVGTRRGETQQAGAAIAEAESLIDPSTPPKQTAVFALATSIHFVYAGEYEKAVGCVLRQAAICREMGDEWQTQLALSGAAFYECGLGRFDAAIAKLRDAIATMRRLNVPYGIGNSQAFIACAYALRGDRDEALTNGRAAVPHLQRVGTVAWILPFIALVHAQQGSPQKAVCLVGYFDAEWAGERQSYAPFIIQTRDKVIALAHATLGAEEIRRHAAAGGALTEEQAIALAFDSSDANN